MASLPQRVGCSTEELVVLTVDEEEEEEEEVMVVDEDDEDTMVTDALSTDRNTRWGRKLRLGSDAMSSKTTRQTKSSKQHRRFV